MAKPKAQTLQQRFGFLDDDLKTPNHDEIMQWLNAHSVDVAKGILGWSETWDQETVNKLKKETMSFIDRMIFEYSSRIEEFEDRAIRDAWSNQQLENANNKLSFYRAFDGLGELPLKPEIKAKCIWERAISREKFIIGFVDMLMVVDQYSLSVDNITKEKRNDYGMLTEVDELPKYELIYSGTRFYFEVKTAIPSIGELLRQINMYREYTESLFFVVSPEDKFIKQLNDQGVGFIKYPTGEIYKPQTR